MNAYNLSNIDNTGFFFSFQFYSHIVLIACSDKSLKVFDINAQKISRDLAYCHAKPVSKMLMVSERLLESHSNMFR